MRITSLVMFLAYTGCIDPETVDETSSEIGVGVYLDWSATNNNVALKWVGTTATQTCFLRGISGDIKGTPAQPARVEVIPQGGSWYINVKSGTGTGVKAHVICVNVPWAGAANELSWQDNVGGSVSAMVANRQCYLRSVWSSIGLGANNANITLQKFGGTWNMDPSLAVGNGANRAGATAVCIDTPTFSEGDYIHNGPLAMIATNPIPVSSSSTACGLTRITSAWPNPNALFGVDDGAYARKSGATWTTTASNRKSGRWHCFR